MILICSILSGVLGRMGGAKGFDTKFRDWGCPSIFLGVWIHHFGFVSSMWWIYLIVFFLMWGALATYWDWLFDGQDNLWFSGFMVGFSAMPLVFIHRELFTLLLIRSIILMVLWGCLNKFLPPRILFWNRDVAEEFSRYAVSL